jgi:hypothetical protein
MSSNTVRAIEQVPLYMTSITLHYVLIIHLGTNHDNWSLLSTFFVFVPLSTSALSTIHLSSWQAMFELGLSCVILKTGNIIQ